MIINENELIRKALSFHIDPEVYIITKDKRGMPNVLFRRYGSKWFIHSSYDSVKDGDTFARNCYSCEKNLAVFGMGLGYHIKSLITMLAPGQRLHIFETNFALLKIAFETTDIKEHLQNENVFLYAGDSLEALAKYFFSCIYQDAVFISYPPVMNTVPGDIGLIQKYSIINQAKEYLGVKPLNLDDIKSNINYTPISRKKPYKVSIIGYGAKFSVIESFINNMASALEYLGCETVFVTFDQFSGFLNKWDNSPIYESIISSNFFVCFDVSYIGSLFDRLKAPLISIRVDRPYAPCDYMRNEVRHTLYTWTYQCDLKYAGLYYMHGSHYFMPHGAELNFDTGSIFKQERFIDVVVSCNYHTDKVFEQFAYPDNPFDIELINNVLNYYRESGKQLEDCVKDVIGKSCTDDTLYQFMHDVGFAIDITVRLENRYRVIKALLDGGVTVHLFGSGWDLTDIANHPLCIYHGQTLYEAGRVIFEHCKILINNLPAYQGSGAHERVFSSMVRGALCVSNATDYLRKTFAEDKEIVFYDNNDLDALVQKVKYYLSHEGERLQITKNAFENVRANHTWINRADDIITMYEEFKEREGLN